MNQFNYHINLHYSQTSTKAVRVFTWFNYHINLHYSQTQWEHSFDWQKFNYDIVKIS